ncbi:hypothetical protein IPH25_02170 [bacterium]|nr:MAG: hypothetical protein IPH25_02170 [bacterium]
MQQGIELTRASEFKKSTNKSLISYDINSTIAKEGIKEIQADESKIILLTWQGTVYVSIREEVYAPKFEKINTEEQVSHILYPFENGGNQQSLVYSVAKKVLKDSVYLYDFTSETNSRIATHNTHIFKLGQLTTKNKDHKILSNSRFPNLTFTDPNHMIQHNQKSWLNFFLKKPAYEGQKENTDKKPVSFKHHILLAAQDDILIFAFKNSKKRFFNVNHLNQKVQFIPYNIGYNFHFDSKNTESTLNTPAILFQNILKNKATHQEEPLDQYFGNLSSEQLTKLMTEEKYFSNLKADDLVSQYLFKKLGEKSQIKAHTEINDDDDDEKAIQTAFENYQQALKAQPTSSHNKSTSEQDHTIYQVSIPILRKAPIAAINSEYDLFKSIVLKTKTKLILINSANHDHHKEITLKKSMERKPTALYLTYPFMRTKDILIKNIMNNNVPLWLIFVYKHGIYHLDLQENSLKTPQELVKLNTDQSILCSCFDRNAKKLYYVAQDNKKTTLKILNIVSLNQDREEERTRAQAEIDQKAKKIQGYLQQTPEEKKKAQARKTEGAAKALEKFVNALTKAQ